MSKPLKVFGRKEIAEAKDLPIVTFPVPEWDTEEEAAAVLLKPLAGWQRDEWDKECQIAKNNGDAVPQSYRAKLVRKALVDESGKPLYGEGPEEIKALANKGAAALDRLFDEVVRLSGMGATAVKDAEKNSETAPSDSSGSS